MASKKKQGKKPRLSNATSVPGAKVQVESGQVFETWYRALDPLISFLGFFGIGAHGKILLHNLELG